MWDFDAEQGIWSFQGFYFIGPLIVIVCRMVFGTLMLNETFEVSKVLTSFVH